MDKPTPNLVDQAVARVAKTGAARYFFDQLHNPEWILPLYERGFFKRPPPVIRDADERTITFPDWPELRYLQRMAPQRPEEVGQVVADMAESDNPRVQELLLQIGEHLPLDRCGPLADRALKWLESPLTRFSSGGEFAKFVARLVALGEKKRSLVLATRLLGLMVSARTAMDSFYLERDLGLCLPSLESAFPVETLRLLRGLLMDSTRDNERDPNEDYSYIWRRDLAKENYRVKEPKDILVDALRDSALRLSRRESVGFPAVREILIAGKRPILKRLAIYVAAEVSDEQDSFVQQVLFAPIVVDRQTYRAEYARLLQTMVPCLSPQRLSELIQFLTVDFLRSIPPLAFETLSVDRREQIAKSIELQRLLAFGDVLPLELVGRRDALLQEMGNPADRRGPVFAGPVSPRSEQELGQMSIKELVVFLSGWKPTGEFGSATREGLSRSLHVLARARPTDFSSQANLFEDQDPTYVRGIIQGLADAITSKERMEWNSLFTLLLWVCAQPIGTAQADASSLGIADVGWSWTRQAIARLIENALNHVESGLSRDDRKQVWSVIHSLLQDPDPPAPADDEDADREPLTRSINSVRGLALRCVFRYLWWLHGDQFPQQGEPENFEHYPEVREALEAALNDGAPAVRCVLGEYFPSVYYFARAWARQHVDRIFPEQPEAGAFWRATWGVYVEYAQPYDAAFPILRSKYEFALHWIAAADELGRKQAGERGLGQHLASYFWRFLDGEGSFDRMLLYFDVCSPESVGHTLWFFGSALTEVESVNDQTRTNLMRLWERLRQRSAGWPEQKRRELVRHFGTWFNSKHFDPTWALAELLECLKTQFGLIGIQNILVRLETLATSHSLQVSECLREMVRSQDELRQPFVWERELGAVLKALLSVEDETVRQRVRCVIDSLVEGGNLFAKDLLPKQH